MKIDVTRSIPIVDGEKITKIEFESNYLKTQQPVILRG